MRAACVVEQEVACKLLPGFGYAFIGAQVDVLVFHALPQPFHEHVVYPPTLAIHTDFDVVVLEHLDEAFTRELTSLVGVEDIRPAILGYRYVHANRGCRLPQRFRPNPWRSTVFLQKVAFGISPKYVFSGGWRRLRDRARPTNGSDRGFARSNPMLFA